MSLPNQPGMYVLYPSLACVANAIAFHGWNGISMTSKTNAGKNTKVYVISSTQTPPLYLPPSLSRALFNAS